MSNFIRHLLKKNNVPTYQFTMKKKNLYELLSVQPNGGVGLKVTAKEWLKKGHEQSYYKVTRVQLKTDLEHGKAWGILYMNGKKKEDNTRIRTGLKLDWELFNGHQPVLIEFEKERLPKSNSSQPESS